MKELKRRRIKAGLTQLALARKCGFNSMSVWQWEAGRRFPRVQNLKRLAKALRCEIRDLV